MNREDAQKLLDEFAEKLGEQCIAFTLFVEFEEDGDDDGTFNGWQSKGSINHVLGLARRNLLSLEQDIIRYDAFSKDDDDDQ